MTSRPLRLGHEAATELREHLDAAAASAGLDTEYPAAALAEATAAVASYAAPATDLTHLPFVTIDPEGSTDLDQALWLQAEDDGVRVHYAIADVPGFVAQGGELDAETHHRGETAYLPHRRLPLHPEVISEDAGSLLPGQVRGAYVWEILVGADGGSELVSLTRATVTSREQLSYPQAQERLEAGNELMVTLHRLGELRRADESRRGGADLRLPEQEVELSEHGKLQLSTRTPLPIEEDNAQVSLLTGICAARLMLQGGVGLLRTMPPPEQEALDRFRAVAHALGHPWEGSLSYGEYLRTLDASRPRQLAILHAAASLFRGAAYTPFSGQAPEQTEQAAVGAPYAHTTAPLRRLVDRFALVVCHALAEGQAPPAEVVAALEQLPEAMRAAGSAVGTAERACVDIIEAALLEQHVGSDFDAVVVDGPVPSPDAPPVKALPDADAKAPAGSVKVALVEPPVQAKAAGSAPAGSRVRVRVDAVDVPAGKISLSLID